MNLTDPLVDKVDFANAPTDDELLLAAEEEHNTVDEEPIPDPFPNLIANANNTPNINPHILTVSPLYTTPILYPTNVLPPYTECKEVSVVEGEGITCLPLITIPLEV